MVIYEGLARSPTVLFNEKVLCGLGRGVSITGKLEEVAVERATKALVRYSALANQAEVQNIHIIATAAAREAANGPAFIDEVNKIFGVPVRVLTGKEEAYFAAFGVQCGFVNPDGICGDLGGGSLELIDVAGSEIGAGATLPLGGIRLEDASNGDLDKARELAREHIRSLEFLKQGKGRSFYAVGGTWRALAKLHIHQTDYPLHVMHHYEFSADVMKNLCEDLISKPAKQQEGIENISSNRASLLPYGAINLLEILDFMQPDKIVVSALGVREGYLYSQLKKKDKLKDPLIVASKEMAKLRSRSPQHAKELCRWTRAAFAIFGVDETFDESRYRDAACLLADIGWRAHPEYRAMQSMNVISNAAFFGVDHAGRAYLSLANYYRHYGLIDEEFDPTIAQLANARIRERTRLLGALFRVAYVFSAAMPNILPKIEFVELNDGAIELHVPENLISLLGEVPSRRLNHLAKLTGRDISINIKG
jgi:exopolyphosphatase/guanosine-5'-triphosphate,3'-diphosphate pyrophosphatase